MFAEMTPDKARAKRGGGGVTLSQLPVMFINLIMFLTWNNKLCLFELYLMAK